jgi:hypothetical protein
MTAPRIKFTFSRRPWCVPSAEHAFDGCIEGRPTNVLRAAVVARLLRRRLAWNPDAEAWAQLIELQRVVGQRVRIQFWSPVMYLLADDEWPHPVEARCEGVLTLIEDGRLQAFLVLRDPVEVQTGGSSGLSYLIERGVVTGRLAPVAALFEVETVAEAS